MRKSIFTRDNLVAIYERFVIDPQITRKQLDWLRVKLRAMVEPEEEPKA